jgi:hypothetical protein
MPFSLYPSFYRTVILFLFISRPFISNCQDKHLLTCAEVRNGTFYYINQRDGTRETFIRKGGLQREIIPKRKETLLWDVNWLNDCTYTLKYESGGENHPLAEQKFLGKHLIVAEILHVTEDYMTFRTAIDKVTNPSVLNDTLWIRQRQSMAGKSVSNPYADSLLADRVRTMDSLQATYATLYAYRPGRFLNSLMNYNLLINGEPACVISNGCREILKLHRAGSFRISAKIYGPEQAVTLDVKPGESYYLQCLCIWGIASHPALILMNKEEGEAEFKTVEKSNLIHRE